MAEEAQRLGVSQITEIARNASGTPLISALFETARGTQRIPFAGLRKRGYHSLSGFFNRRVKNNDPVRPIFACWKALGHGHHP
jgi:hypothetical protein